MRGSGVLQYSRMQDEENLAGRVKPTFLTLITPYSR
jgi:hypothetical protein